MALGARDKFYTHFLGGLWYHTHYQPPGIVWDEQERPGLCWVFILCECLVILQYLLEWSALRFTCPKLHVVHLGVVGGRAGI